MMPRPWAITFHGHPSNAPDWAITTFFDPAPNRIWYSQCDNFVMATICVHPRKKNMHATTENNNHAVFSTPFHHQPDNRLITITIHQIKLASAKGMEQLPTPTNSKMTTTTSSMTMVKA